MVLTSSQPVLIEKLNTQETQPVSEISNADLKENQMNGGSHTTLRFGYDGKEIGSIRIPVIKHNFSPQDQELKVRGGSDTLPKLDEE